MRSLWAAGRAPGRAAATCPSSVCTLVTGPVAAPRTRQSHRIATGAARRP